MKKLGFLCLMLLLCTGFTTNKTDASAAAKTKLQETESTIFINEKYTIPLTGKLKKATYVFTSNKTKIAKVNSKGIITGINSGTASIKIRYKYKDTFYSVGTFKVTIHKSSLNTKYKSMDMLTGETLEPSSYLEGINPNASYIITSSVSAVAKGGSDGVITATKAGRTAISIHEVFNNRSRTVGSIALSVTGASLKRNEIKMAYNSSISLDNLLDDIDRTSNNYYLISDNKSLISDSSNTQIKSASRGKEDQTCSIIVDEEIKSNKQRHTIGSFKVIVTNETFISFLNKDVLIGFGEVITVANSGIVIQNKVAGAQYKLTPKDTSVLKTEEIKNRSTNLEAIGYGITSVSIEEIKGNNTRLLEDTVDVTVSQAYITKDLADNGYEVSVNGGDTFGRYPFECRNLKAVYDYTSASSNICGAGADNENHLIITPKKVGTTEISVYETMVNTNAQTKVTTRSRKKIGSFNVIVHESGYTPSNTPVPGTTATPAPSTQPGTSSTPVPGTSSTPRPSSSPGGTDISLEQFLDDPVASNLINSIRLEYNGKTYYGYASETGLECLFGDDDNYSDYIDYGTNFDNITIDDFTITFANSGYQFVSLESFGGTEWSLSVQLNDEDNTVEEVPIYLNTGEFDTNSILSSITVSLGSAKQTVNSSTPFFDDNETMQFDEGNKDFEVYFTPKQYERAGSDEYFDLLYPDAEDYPEDPKTLADLTNVSCTYTQSGINPAVRSISQPETDDNSYWTFEVEFEDGTTEEFSVELKVDDEDYY